MSPHDDSDSAKRARGSAEDTGMMGEVGKNKKKKATTKRTVFWPLFESVSFGPVVVVTSFLSPCVFFRFL